MADKILEKIDASRRSFVKRLLGTGFAAPIIASFSIEALTSTAQAIQASNQTCDATQDAIERAGFWDGAAGSMCDGKTVITTTSND